MTTNTPLHRPKLELLALLFGIAVCVLDVAAEDLSPSAPPRSDTSAVSEPVTVKQLTKLSLDELSALEVETVYGASKHEQQVTEAPSAVTIISRDEIQKYGYRTLADLLNSVPGLYTRSDRNYSLLGIRGFGKPGSFNNKFQILLNGHRMNNGVTDAGWIDNGFGVDVDLIERVEIIRGPGSLLYGDSAFLGVVDVITRRGRNLGGAEASVSGGSLDTYAGRFSYGNQFSNGVELVMSGSYLHSQGYPRLYYPAFDTPASNNGIAEHADGQEAASIFTALSWRELSLEGGFVERTKHIPTGSFGTVFNDPRTQVKDAQVFLDLKLEHRFANELNLIARLGYDRGTEDGDYIYDYGLPDRVVNIDRYLGQRLTGDVQLSRTFLQKHAVTVGAQVMGNLNQDQKNFDLNPPAVYLDDHQRGANAGLFVQDEYQILQNLIFNGGVRYDYFDTFGGTVNPRLALIYQPAAATTLRFSYATAFHSPSPNELYYSDGGLSQVPSPLLQPETIRSFELSADQRIGKHFTTSAAGFYYQIHDLIQETTLPPGDPNAGVIQLENLGAAEAKGIELALKGSWVGGLKARASYTWTDARDGITGERLVNSPVHLAKLNVSAPLYQEKVFAGLELQYASGRLTLAGQKADGFLIANFTVFSRDLLPRLELSASVYNLFNTHYSEPGGPEHVQDLIPQDGRQFRLKATWRF